MRRARPAAFFLSAALTACSGGGAPLSSAPRPSRRALAAPVPASKEASSTDEVMTLVPPSFDRVRIGASTFLMGSTQSEVVSALQVCMAEPRGDPELCERAFEYANEMSDHEVYLSEYWIDRDEVTVERYRTCVSSGVCSELPYSTGGARFDVPSYPVVLVNWFEARKFCVWAGGRLPTEAEWERAARGAHGRRYPWGNVYNASLANHGQLSFDDIDDSDGFLEMAPVGSFRDGMAEGGIADMAGNVEEWVADWYAPAYVEASIMNPKGPDSGDDRVVRGGSYVHPRASLRCAARGHTQPDQRRAWRGFRCAYDAK